MKRAGGLALLALALACSRPAPGPARQALEAGRLEKDMRFRTGADSPIPPQDRAAFPGLRYFPVDQTYRAEAVLRRVAGKEPLQLASSRGERREAVRVGRLEFTLQGQALHLSVFKLLDPDVPPSQLFVPFTDATSGNETYGAGRYLDLEEHPSDRYVLDFNLAYNPYCAYNPEYDCPFPPRENRLPVPIRAGERVFPEH